MLIKLSVCSKTISIYATTHASGNVVGEQRYYPFGETRWSTGSMFTDKLFTGQREMAGLGIYHYQARFYSPYINRFLSADTIVPNYANPQSLNRYSYVNNSPLNYTDPTGHYCVGDLEGCRDETGNPVNGAPLYLHHDHDEDDDQDKPLKDMRPGDIITFETVVDGEVVAYNYMLGVMDDHNTLGFWDLDTHSYISYEVVALTVNLADSWTTFRRTDPKTFNSYEVAASSGMPSSLPSYSVAWTGGMDDKPAYVEVYTQVDWENVPSQFAWAVLGPSLVTSFWGDAKPTVTPLSQAGYYPLTNYVVALSYFANDGAAIARYPIIHP